MYQMKNIKNIASMTNAIFSSNQSKMDTLLEIPKLNHILVTIFVIFLCEIIKTNIANQKRKRLAIQEGELYHRNLQLLSIKELEPKLKLAQGYAQLYSENRRLGQELEKFNGGAYDVLKCDDSSDKTKSLQNIRRHLNRLKTEDTHQRSVLNEVRTYLHSRLQDPILHNPSVEQINRLDTLGLIDTLKEKIEESREEIKNHSDQYDSSSNDFDSVILEKPDKATMELISRHNLNDLINCHHTLCRVELNWLDKFRKGVFDNQQEYYRKLAKLNSTKQELDLELKSMEKDHQQLLDTTIGSAIAEFINIKGYEDYISGLEILDENMNTIMSRLKVDIESRKEEIEYWKESVNQARKEHEKYQMAYEEACR